MYVLVPVYLEREIMDKLSLFTIKGDKSHGCNG